MPRCPNCGRETQRTQDWACQWCGQPLLSGGYKTIPKTYRELQEERAGYVRPEIEEEEITAPEPEAHPEEISPPPPEIEPEPAPRAEPPPKPAPKPKQRKAPPEPEPPPPEPQPEISAEPEAEPEAPAAPEPVIEAPEPEAPAALEPVTEAPEPETPAAAEPVAEEPEPAVKPEQVPEPEPAPPVEAAPAPPPAVAPDLEPEKSTGMIVTTADDLAAAFARDRATANAKLMDKVLRITGTVDKVFVKDHLDIFYIVLTSSKGQSSWQVRCTFGREQGPALTRLTVGQTETVQGRYVGYEKNIILKECVLVR